MTTDEAIFKMLVQVLKNQRLSLRIARAKMFDGKWRDEVACDAAETEDLLEQVMEK